MEVGLLLCQDVNVSNQALNYQTIIIITCLIVVDCEDPGTPINGTTSVITTTFGSLANHTCFNGFLLDGASQRQCLPDGNWSPDLPNCIRKLTKK